MSMDEIDREAAREGQAVSKLRGFRGSRSRARGEKSVKTVSDEQAQRAWAAIKGKQ